VDIILIVKKGKLHTILADILYFNHIYHKYLLFYGAGGLDAFAVSSLPSTGRVAAHSLSCLPGLFTLKEVIA